MCMEISVTAISGVIWIAKVPLYIIPRIAIALTVTFLSQYLTSTYYNTN